MFDIKRYEKMVKIELTDEERSWAVGEAEKLFESFETLDRVETSNTEPLVSVLEALEYFREDEAVKNFTRDELLENAPEQYDGYFQVPKTVE